MTQRHACEARSLGHCGAGPVDLRTVRCVGSTASCRRPVETRESIRASGIDTWDVVHATLVFEDGIIATSSSTWVLPEAGEGIVDFRFQAIATEGAVSANLTHQGLQIVTDRPRSAWPIGQRIGRSPTGQLAWMANDFATALITGDELGPGVEQGLLITKTLVAIEQSLTTGLPVDIGA